MFGLTLYGGTFPPLYVCTAVSKSSAVIPTAQSLS